MVYARGKVGTTGSQTVVGYSQGQHSSSPHLYVRLTLAPEFCFVSETVVSILDQSAETVVAAAAAAHGAAAIACSLQY